MVLIGLVGVVDSRIHVYVYNNRTKREVHCAYYGTDDKNEEVLIGLVVVVDSRIHVYVYNNRTLFHKEKYIARIMGVTIGM